MEVPLCYIYIYIYIYIYELINLLHQEISLEDVQAQLIADDKLKQ